MSFSVGIGNWLGTAEVYSGTGQFLGNGADRRHVQKLDGENRIRIDVAFLGPFKFSGHYYITDREQFRLYQGPANVGCAESLTNHLVDANAYWAAVGLTQRFFLVVLPDGSREMSLGLMSRGEQLVYVVVSEYNREQARAGFPELTTGASFDLQNDPNAGRKQTLLHRAGVWKGQMNVLGSWLEPLSQVEFSETVTATPTQLVTVHQGGHFEGESKTELTTNGWHAWTTPETNGNRGSYSLYGGRALSGTFHNLHAELRVWRREVVANDGTHKVVVNTWYRGGQRIGQEFGVLYFEGNP